MLWGLREANKRIKWKDRKPYAYWKGNPSTSGRRGDLMKCNVSDKNDWKARIYAQVNFFDILVIFFIHYNNCAIIFSIYIYIMVIIFFIQFVNILLIMYLVYVFSFFEFRIGKRKPNKDSSNHT
jgi:hypothetical protein